MSDVSFSGKWINVVFTGANLSNAEFVNVDLSGAQLSDCDLSNAKLDRQLCGVDFSGSEMRGVHMDRNAKLEGCKWVGVKNDPRK